MPVSVTLRNDNTVTFHDAKSYTVGADLPDSLDVLFSDGKAYASFHPNAWQYVSITPAPDANPASGGHLEQATAHIALNDNG